MIHLRIAIGERFERTASATLIKGIQSELKAFMILVDWLKLLFIYNPVIQTLK